MSAILTSEDQARLTQAETQLRAGKVGQAIGILQEVTRNAPGHAAANYQLAVALMASGDQRAAEHHLRATLEADPNFTNAAVRLATMLTPRQQAAESEVLLAPFIDTPNADLALLTAYALALKTLGRAGDALRFYERAVAVAPTSGIAEHNLASVLGDIQRYSECEAATRRAFAKGLDVAETWLVRGRALQGLGEYDEAEAAYRRALRLRSDYADAHAELAQLVWMRTEDSAKALEAMDITLDGREGDPGLSLAKARFLEYAGDKTAALSALDAAMAGFRPDPNVLIAAAHLTTPLDPRLGLIHAERAVEAAPDSWPAKTALCQANLALGRGDVAALIAEDLCRAWPMDQYPISLLGTAWRMLGDPRYRQLYDYDRLVSRRPIDIPPGWSTLEGYLSDFAASLRALQTLRGHPIGQSLRLGAQTGQSLALSDDPVVVAFFKAIDAPIRSYIAMLRDVDDVLGRRVNDGYRFAGSWSALLRPGGYHVNHLHPQGWISSACHIELPDAIERGHDGWLQFGEPGLPTHPRLGAEHFVKPTAGTLVLFPSYMWHGTVPFEGSTPRLSVAFDVLPA